MQFHELCKQVSSNLFIACLRDLCTSFWNVTLIYHQIHEWHSTHQVVNHLDPLDQKLMHGRIRLWQDIQKKTRTFLLSSDLWHFTIDEFLHVLDIVDRLMEVGRQFCDTQSDILQESVRQQSINYFRSFHRGRLDELRVFLEHEAWECCPVRPNFNVLQLAEFHFLRDTPQIPGGTIAESTADKEQFYSISCDKPANYSPFHRCGFGPTNDENIMANGSPTKTQSTEEHDQNWVQTQILFLKMSRY